MFSMSNDEILLIQIDVISHLVVEYRTLKAYGDGGDEDAHLASL
jgi:hypothetical protein